MSDLTPSEKSKLEKLFSMGYGYVLDFSNDSFKEFILSAVSINIFSEEYDYYSGSKANRLRAFFNKEPNHVVGTLLGELIEHYKVSNNYSIQNEELYRDCLKIVERLKTSPQVNNIVPNSDDRDFHLLSKSIMESIEKNQPEVALDRLHTFCVKYIKELCKKHAIPIEKDEPLHSLFGKYVKFLISNKMLESEMSEKILKSSISLLDAFNNIRNNKSLAHDNPLLNYNESLLIFNNISNIINFIESIEE